MTDAPISADFVIRDYGDLITAFATRRRAMGVSQFELDQRTGLPDGYTGKIEISAAPNRQKNARGLGRESLPLMLQALGAELVMRRRGSTITRTPIPASIRGAMGGNKRAERLSSERRREIAANAAKAKWAKRAAAS